MEMIFFKEQVGWQTSGHILYLYYFWTDQLAALSTLTGLKQLKRGAHQGTRLIHILLLLTSEMI